MYKVMLVDDEKLILNGLRMLIDWNEIGLEIVCTAGNGEEAMELFQESPVDIVITDITMPKMNGLLLIEELKKLNKDTRFIILSGYDDFNYAKQAIHLGIENYIIKPINEEELTETLCAIIKKLDAIERTPIIEGKKLELIKENILYRWVHNSISNYELEERNTILGINLSMDHYGVAVIKLDVEDSEELGMQQRIYKRVKDLMSKTESGNVFVDLEANLVCVLGMNKQQQEQEQQLAKACKDFFGDVINEIKKDYGIDAFAAVGELVSGYRNVSQSYESALRLRKYLLVSGYNHVVDSDTCSTGGNRYDGSIDTAEFQRIIMTKDKDQITSYLENLLGQMQVCGDAGPDDIQNLAIKFILVLNGLSHELGFTEHYSEDFIKQQIISICKIDTIEELKDMLEHVADELVDRFKQEMTVKSPIVRRIIALIKENYSSELSLKTLGQKYNVNPSYLGQVFYKETGEQFSEYLNRIRNEHARNLLLNTDQRIHEIAKCVGYTDNSYFYKKFKEVYGVSPNTLRTSKNYN